MPDTFPSLSISDVIVTEGQTATFTVTLSQASSQIITVGYTFKDWTATSNAFRKDFSTTFSSLTFDPGETQKTISVLTSDDGTDEDTEAFLMELNNPFNATLADKLGQGTIQDNDTSTSTLTITSLDPVSGTSESPTVMDSLGTFIDINFSYQNNAANPVYIFADSAGGSLTLGSAPYAIGSGTGQQGVSRSAAPGEITAVHLYMQEALPSGGFGNVIKEVSVPVSYLFTGQTDLAVSKSADSETAQLDQEFTYTVNLSSFGPYSAEEVELTEILPKGVTYVRSFPPAEVTQVGDTTQLKLLVDSVSTFFDRSISITVKATADSRPAGNPQEWSITTSSSVTSRSRAITGDPVAANNTTTQTITITDSPVLISPVLSIGNATVQEGDSGTKNMVFTVSLSAASSSPVSVSYETYGGSAITGSDFIQTLGVLAFAAGETSKTITVPIIGDTSAEAPEGFGVHIFDPVGAEVVFPGNGFGTIFDDDDGAPAQKLLTLSDGEIQEGNSGTTALNFTVSLSEASSETVTVDYETLDDTAIAGADYTAASGTLTFNPGETSKTITVAVTGDTQVEADETLLINLSQPVNAMLTDSQATGTIQNDDVAPLPAPPAVQFETTSTQQSEAAQSFNLVLNRSGDLGSASSVQINVTGGTATAADYTQSFPLVVEFAANQQTQTFSIPIVQDALVEGTETLTLELSNPNGAQVGTTRTATLEILDDDTSPKPSDPFTGGAGNDAITGNKGNNRIVGGDGNDILNGSDGRDILAGGQGRDRFVFDINRKFRAAAIGIDRITDFKPKEDKIVLDRSTFTRLKPFSFATVKNIADAKKDDALITYIRKTGTLFYNENGAKAGFGQGGPFADLNKGLALSKADFSVLS